MLICRLGPWLLRHQFAGSSRLDRKFAKFRQPILPRQYGLCVVQVENWFERYARPPREHQSGQVGGWVLRWPPQRGQNCRSLISILLKWPTNSFPFVTATSSAFHKRQARREESGGNIYHAEKLKLEGWLCPALLRYFPEAPKQLYVQVKTREGVLRAHPS